MLIPEITGEFILLWIIQYPGALIRWAISRRKSYKEYLGDDLYINSLPVFILLTTVVLLTNLDKLKAT